MKRRAGFTLIEMLVVLLVLAALAALAWPALRGALDRGALRQAARQVKSAMARARLSAIESGRPREFRFQPGGARAEVRPLVESASAPAPRRDQTPADEMPVDEMPVDGVTSAEPADSETIELPAGVTFADPELIAPTSDQVPVERHLDEPQAAPRWSRSIVFEPAGRADRAKIVLLGAAGARIALGVEALCGAVSISAVERPEEQP